ncbi:HAD-IIA family hydrolase [Ornithinimicrobium faecis]|uniref:HAD-IIA family hydrolase n=1 Tax=Ornithinimicrobium faecis TaxID=2934158 RepID=A0ABY4YNU7_9MICO|nr:HAD-IIA family hydrolase [Ornithinimicrobium sp. HY1793]USQ78383.1 HAD-IIA family hydrolase [Ornithinimicrobium sp. HY1793]
MTYRGLLCDLDGVVYRGASACDGAVEGLAAARAAGLLVLFLTNNAARLPAEVSEHLVSLGVEAHPDEVLNSSQVAASHLRQHHPVPEGTVVLAIGGPGVAAALVEEGLPAITPREVVDHGGSEQVSVVVQGLGKELGWAELTEATYAVAAGAHWVATNTDATLPTERGQAPGNGSLIAAVAHATGRQPDLITGKPHAPAFEIALQRLGLPAAEVLMIGDRLDTDIEGAKGAGLATALVLTGVHGRSDVESAGEDQQPDHIVEVIGDLAPHWSHGA